VNELVGPAFDRPIANDVLLFCCFVAAYPHPLSPLLSYAAISIPLTQLDPIAPDPLIKDDGNGVYWSLTYTRGVRLRVMPIDSDAGWSGLFFD